MPKARERSSRPCLKDFSIEVMFVMWPLPQTAAKRVIPEASGRARRHLLERSHQFSKHLCCLFLASFLCVSLGRLGHAQVKTVTSMNETLSFGGPEEGLPKADASTLQVSGALSGLISREAGHSLNLSQSAWETSNAFFIVQKNTGMIQFFAQAGHYAINTLGAKTNGASSTEKNSFGAMPHAYVSLNPNENWSIAVGKLLSMPGYENPFTYQNQNIQRGVLENQNNTISQGIQLNYTGERSTLFWSLNDGFYSGQLKWLGLGGSYKFNANHSSNLMLGGAYRSSNVNTDLTPRLQNNSQILNLVHAYKMGAWSLTPYYQYTRVPKSESSGLASAAYTEGYALIINHQGSSPWPGFTSRAATLSLPLRFEYIKANDYRSLDAQELVFGPKSDALSLTFTPTLQSGIYFARTEWSWLKARRSSRLQETALSDSASTQVRVLLELGLLY